jgi:hypothetical protein
MSSIIKFLQTEDNKEGIASIVPCTIEFTINGAATTGELVEQFTYFLKAMGYYVPENAQLDWVDVETGQPPEDDEVANISIKRKFKK